jgi:amino acid transporter
MAMLFSGVGYLCFAACMAEMLGTLPFSGGVYGFVRAFIGPFFGYVVSRFEILMIICYLSPLVQSLGTFPTVAGISSQEMEPAWWLFFSGTAVGIAMVGCNYVEYWVFIKLIGALSLLLVWIYIFGSLDSVNYERWSDGGETIEWGEFLPRIYQTAGMFRGVQYLPLVSVKLADVSNLP